MKVVQETAPKASIHSDLNREESRRSRIEHYTRAARWQHVQPPVTSHPLAVIQMRRLTRSPSRPGDRCDPGRHLARPDFSISSALAFRSQLPPAQAVQVQMVLRLASVISNVCRNTVPRLRDAHLLSHLRDRPKHPRDDRPVLVPDVPSRWNMLSRYRKEVDGRLSPGITLSDVEDYR